MSHGNDACETCPKGTARGSHNAFDVLRRLVNFALFTEVAGNGEDTDQHVINYACPDRASISPRVLVCELSSWDAGSVLLEDSFAVYVQGRIMVLIYLYLMLVCYRCFSGIVIRWSNSYTRFNMDMDIVYVYVHVAMLVEE